MRHFIEQIVKEAGVALLRKFKQIDLQHRAKKNPADVVTEADILANEILISRIRAKYPSHGIISEETGGERDHSKYVWIIDPLDGTRNFLTHTPLWGVMVGLARGRQMIAAAIYDPCQEELIVAEKGKGAFKNGRRVRCSLTNKLTYSRTYALTKFSSFKSKSTRSG